MLKTKANRFAASLAAVALSLSLGLVSPAQAASGGPVSKSVTATTEQAIWVTQEKPGSRFALLQWIPLPGATEYRIYNALSYRPTWKLIFIAPATSTNRNIVDRPGTVSVYRIVAVVNGKEVNMGRYYYYPKK